MSAHSTHTLRQQLRLYWVMDGSDLDTKAGRARVTDALQSGVGCVQLRDKHSDTRTLIERTRTLLRLAQPWRVLVIVNDRVDVALAAGAHGVHLGQSDTPLRQARALLGTNAVIGLSIEHPNQLHEPDALAADYLAISPVFDTPTKTNTAPAWGLQGLRQARQATQAPLVAIGGIDAARLPEVWATGVDGVAVVRAISDAADTGAASTHLRSLMAQARPWRVARVLAIAGSDSGGCAGIQADLKTCAALGCHGMSAVTALTAQNTVGVQAIRAGYARIFSDAMLKHWLAELATQSIDSELRERNVGIAQKLLDRDKYRTLRKISQPNINAIKSLHNKHPHFKAVIEFVLQRLRMAEVTAKPLRLPPILLHGFPGLGKTHFCNDLAAALGTHLRRLPYDSEQTSAALLGSDKKWSTSTCGALFDELVQGQYANPVFLLDEIDKARIFQNDNPLASLHSLLEPVSAASVRDISVEFTFDASHVFWIAAGNDIGKLPDSLRSRFEIFMILPPFGEDALKLAHNIVKEQLASMAAAEMQPPSFRQIMRMAHLTPRELIRALEAAYASAIHVGRKHLLDTDIPAWAWLVDEDESGTDSGDDPSSRPHGVTVH